MTTPLINRRQFIQLLATASTAWSTSLLASTRASIQTLGQDEDLVYKNLSDPWLTLANVQEYLFPADESSPGARDIYALRFLRNMMDAPDTENEEKEFIIKGIGWLNDLSAKNHQLAFIKLSNKEKESVLRQIESSRAGSRWLSLMMTYLIEALLSDPVYGGNKDKKGWTWLEHQPGFPTPTTDKVYFKLEPHRRRRTKA